jgi:CheY-like chemotaxis protein
VRPAADAKAIQLQLVADPAADHITGDANRLGVGNMEPANERHQVHTCGRPGAGQTDRADSNAQITVSDTGERISREFLPYVFDRFQQADGTTTRKHGGLGLGLAIVRHLVEMHGGRIQARSAGPGQGASFTARIPLVATYSTGPLRTVPSELGKPRSITEESPDLHGLRILAVDDERDTRDMLKGVLEQYGVDVMTAASAREALDALLGWKPDLIVCDIGMPEEDGYSLIEKIRRLEPEQGGNTPAIALTGYVRVEERMRALAAGFNMFVPKPVEADEWFPSRTS